MRKKTYFLFMVVLLALLLMLQAQVVFGASKPGKVTLDSAKATGSNQITITWNKTSGATHYRIYRKNGTSWQRIATVDASRSSYIHTSSSKFPIKGGTDYVYTVRAYNKNTDTAGAYDSTGITVRSLPAQPVLKSVKAGSNQVTLTWSKSAGASDYCIYYKKAGASSWTRIAKVKSSVTSYTHISSKDYPLTSGGVYFYTVRAYSSVAKGYSTYDKKGLTANILPAKVVLGSAVNSGRSVRLSWQKAEGATHYILYYKTVGGKWTRIAKRTASESTTYVHKTNTSYPLLAGSTYLYTVRSYNSTTKTYGEYDTKGLTVTIPKTTASTGSTQKSTLKRFLQTAMEPVGTTMYVWGGGWNEADTGAGEEACTIGVSPLWESFFQKQTSAYNYNNTRYQIHNGLDCSGYVGWCIYNSLNTTSGQAGYVMSASKMAKNFADRGWGSYTASASVQNYKAGDIMSSSGHVYIVVGQCSDGSVVIVHSSPPGVQLSGTPSRTGNTNSEAVKLAQTYMKTYYPDWYAKYPNCAKGSSYLSGYAQMRWSTTGRSVMTDPEGLQNMSAAQVLKAIFS
jgi:hypothetical protein